MSVLIAHDLDESVDSIKECFKLLRPPSQDTYSGVKLQPVSSNGFSFFSSREMVRLRSVDLLTFNVRASGSSFIIILLNILAYLAPNGCCIISVDIIVEKVVLDVIFVLTSWFEKVIIIKPCMGAALSTLNSRFIVCKTLRQCKRHYTKCFAVLNQALKEIGKSKAVTLHVAELQPRSLSIFFLTKIYEANAVIAQGHVDDADELNGPIKQKDIRVNKHSMQRCVQWCEKNKVPCNKFMDKINIFSEAYRNANELVVPQMLH